MRIAVVKAGDRSQLKKRARNGRKHVCPVCQKRFRYKTDLERHGLIHTLQRPFKCTLCDEDFKRQTTLTHHMGMHSLPEKPQIMTATYPSSSPPATYPSSSPPATYPSSSPPESRTMPTAVTNDLSESRSSPSKNPRTASPSSIYTNQEHPSHNRITDTDSGESAASAAGGIAGVKADDRSPLQKSRTQNGRQHVCSVCQKRFRDKTDLERHGLIHTLERPLKCCKLCDEDFQRQTTLRRLMRWLPKKPGKMTATHPRSSSPKTLQTEHAATTDDFSGYDSSSRCGSSLSKNPKTTSPSSIYTNQEHPSHNYITDTDSGESANSAAEGIAGAKADDRSPLQKSRTRNRRKHVCSVCQKWFRHKTDLERHELNHTLERPFKCCALCDEEMLRQPTLTCLMHWLPEKPRIITATHPRSSLPKMPSIITATHPGSSLPKKPSIITATHPGSSPPKKSQTVPTAVNDEFSGYDNSRCGSLLSTPRTASPSPIYSHQEHPSHNHIADTARGESLASVATERITVVKADHTYAVNAGASTS